MTARFEEVAAVRPYRWPRGERHFPVWYRASTTGRYVGFESWLEHDRLILLDFDPVVVGLPRSRSGSTGMTARESGKLRTAPDRHRTAGTDALHGLVHDRRTRTVRVASRRLPARRPEAMNCAFPSLSPPGPLTTSRRSVRSGGRGSAVAPASCGCPVPAGRVRRGPGGSRPRHRKAEPEVVRASRHSAYRARVRRRGRPRGAPGPPGRSCAFAPHPPDPGASGVACSPSLHRAVLGWLGSEVAY